MTSERWHEIKKILGTILDTDHGDLEGELVRLCDGDRELENEVRGFLSADDDLDLPEKALIVPIFDPEERFALEAR